MEIEMLRGIWRAQLDLMHIYISEGKLQAYPLDLGNKKGQDKMREFISVFTEELCEFMEGFENTLKDIQQGKDWQKDIDKIAHELDMEIADALHFIIEILIFSDLHIESLHPLMVTYAEQTRPDIQGDLYSVIEMQGTQDRESQLRGEVQIHNYSIGALSFITASVRAMTTITKAYTGRNRLKIKDWREGESNIENFKLFMAGTFYEFLIFTQAIGITYTRLHEIYFIKNQINLDRIKNG